MIHVPTPAAPIRTTDGTIALFNLDVHIDGLEVQAARGRLTSRSGAELADLLSLRARVRGHIADYERALELAEQLVAHADGVAFLTRAKARASLHRFNEALADLEVAGQLGLGGPELDVEWASILQALGRYDEALVMHRAAVERHATFETLGTLAVFHAERGEVNEAEALFDESRARFRGVSPFGLAQLDFQRALLWIEQRDLARAREWLLEALHRIPAFAPVEGHLAEVEAELGEVDRAIERLCRLAGSSDDPDYATQLARILGESGRHGEARLWRTRAGERYTELVAHHPAAFADHAAEFCLTIGDDPQGALRLAKLNHENRPTPRAKALIERAMAACGPRSPAHAM